MNNIPQPIRYQGWSLNDREPDTIKSFMPAYAWAYHHYFRVQTGGWHHIPQHEPVLFVGSHNGGLAAPDMHMFIYDWYRRFGYERQIYGLMHPKVWDVLPPLAQTAAKFGAVRAHPKMAIAALRAQASVLVYPGGAKDTFRPYYLGDRIYFGGHQGFIKLALRERVPIVPVISWGAHQTFVVLADLYRQVQQLHQWGMPWLLNIDPEVFPIYLGWPWGLAVGPLPHIPWPVQIYTRVCPPIKFEAYGRDTLADSAYVDTCYNQVVDQMQMALTNLIAEAKSSPPGGCSAG
ncbi:MAG TPA: lysophospholipid acyltransferase family protein [Coleofasciculaceae cyanobacterium]